MKTLKIFLAVSVVLEVLLSTRAEYQRAQEQCTTEQCRTEFSSKVAMVQGQINDEQGTTTASVTWGDITTAIVPNGGGD